MRKVFNWSASAFAIVGSTVGFVVLISVVTRISTLSTDLGAKTEVQTMRAQMQETMTTPDPVMVTKTVNVTEVTIGETVNYTIHIDNQSRLAVTASITDALPTELQLLESGAGTVLPPPRDTNVFTQTISVEPMATAVAYYDAYVRTIPISLGTVVNTATVVIHAQNSAFAYTKVVSATLTVNWQNLLPLMKNEPMAIPTSTPAPTTTPTQSPEPGPTSTPVPLSGIIQNPGFEEGPDEGWEETQDPELFPSLIVNNSEVEPPITARSDDFLAWLGGSEEVVAFALRQDVLIPAGYQNVYLQYYYWIDSVDASCSNDLYFVTGASGFEPLCTANNTHGWKRGCSNLTPLVGELVSISFSVVLGDNQANSNFYIDDVTLEETCTPE